MSDASRSGRALPVAPLFALVWLLVLTRILWRDAPVDDAATLALGLLFAIGLTRARPQTLALATALSLAALGFAAALGDWWTLWRGLGDATTFAAFFVTLVVLRTTAERRPETGRTRRLMALLDPRQRTTATLYGANVMGSVLVVGAHAILAPVHDRNAPEPERRRAAIIALRGMGLAGLWSPFWVAMAVGLQHLPEVPLWSVMALGLALAVPALVMGQVMAGAFQGGTRTPLAALLPVVPPVAVAASTVVVLASFTPLRPLEALLLGIPAVCAAAQLPLGRGAVREIVRASYDRTPAVLGELVIVTCAFVLGRVLVGGLDVLDPGLWPEPGTIPATCCHRLHDRRPGGARAVRHPPDRDHHRVAGPVLPGADGSRRPDTVPGCPGFLVDRLDDRAVRDIDRGGGRRSFTSAWNASPSGGQPRLRRRPRCAGHRGPVAPERGSCRMTGRKAAKIVCIHTNRGLYTRVTGRLCYDRPSFLVNRDILLRRFVNSLWIGQPVLCVLVDRDLIVGNRTATIGIAMLGYPEETRTWNAWLVFPSE